MQNQIVRLSLFLAALCLASFIYSESNAADVNGKCEQKGLTTERFLEILREIALHDISDVKFIERALGTQLEVSPGSEGAQIRHRFLYTNFPARSVFGAVILVTYQLDDEAIQQRRAVLDIEWWQDPCISVEPDQIRNLFASSKDFPRVSSVMTDGGGTSCTQYLPTDDKQVGRSVGWQLTHTDELRQAIRIVQYPARPPSNFAPPSSLC